MSAALLAGASWGTLARVLVVSVKSTGYAVGKLLVARVLQAVVEAQVTWRQAQVMSGPGYARQELTEVTWPALVVLYAQRQHSLMPKHIRQAWVINSCLCVCVCLWTMT